MRYITITVNLQESTPPSPQKKKKKSITVLCLRVKITRSVFSLWYAFLKLTKFLHILWCKFQNHIQKYTKAIIIITMDGNCLRVVLNYVMYFLVELFVEYK